MFDPNVSPLLVIALEMVFAGISIALLHHLFRRQRFLLRSFPARLGPVYQSACILIYFTSPSPSLCKTVQRPAIEKLRNRLGSDLQVFVIDVTEQPEFARLWGVCSTPVTFLINPRGELSHINHGVVRAEKLLMQMHGIEIEN